MPLPTKIDYERELRNFELAKAILEHDGVQFTQQEFADELGISLTTLSTRFAEIRRQQDDAEIVRNLRAISKLATNRVAKGIETLEMTSVKDAEGIARIGYGAADRIGFSPQVATINMTQNASANVMVIPPMFSSEETQAIKDMIGDRP